MTRDKLLLLVSGEEGDLADLVEVQAELSHSLQTVQPLARSPGIPGARCVARHIRGRRTGASSTLGCRGSDATGHDRGSLYGPQTALSVVDIQNDFADPSGSLYVPGGEKVVGLANHQVAEARAAGAKVAYTQDWHPPETPHFVADGRHLARPLRAGHVGRGLPPRPGRGRARSSARAPAGRTATRRSPCATTTAPSSRRRLATVLRLRRRAHGRGRRPGHRLLRAGDAPTTPARLGLRTRSCSRRRWPPSTSSPATATGRSLARRRGVLVR